MLRALAIALLSLTTIAFADEDKKEAPSSKPTTVREMILACPESERGPENGKGWKEIQYQRLAAWFADSTTGKRITISVKISGTRANKDGVMTVLSTSAEPAAKVFGIALTPSPITILVDRADEAPFMETKDGQTVTVEGEATYAKLAYNSGGYSKARGVIKLEKAKLIASAKK